MQQALSESKKNDLADDSASLKPLLTEGQESSPQNAMVVGLAQSRHDPDTQMQMSSVQSLVTLQGHLNSKGSGDKHPVLSKEQLSAGEIDDFSLFQQPMEGAQETEVNNTFHEINQSVDQVCQDDPDFQSILSNRMQAQSLANDRQTEEQKTAAQEALLQHVNRHETESASGQSSGSHDTQDVDHPDTTQVAHDVVEGFQEEESKNMPSDYMAQQLPQSKNESSKTARMMQKVSFISAQNSVAYQRTSKSSTRQKRSKQVFALPTFSKEASVNQTQQFELDQNQLAAQQNVTQHQHNQMIQSLQQKLHINLKNLPSTSGGSSSYSNKDLSERLQNLMRQRNQNAAQNVSPTLQQQLGSSYMQWQGDNLDLNSSNRTGTDRDDPMLLSGQPITSAIKSNIPPMPANMSQDPYFYLQWRQQKHKSCRSAHPNHQAGYLLAQRKSTSPGANARTLRLNQGKGRGAKKGAVNDSTSTYSNSSQTTVPVKSLNEVKNPSNLITFRFVSRKVTHLNDIGKFRNLTELDVNGNLLVTGVPELLKLPFLKKLNLSDNQITDMWSLPPTLEILNLSYNCLKRLEPTIMSSLNCLTTLEISNNGIESLEGLQKVPRLKRLIARNNQIQNLEPLYSLSVLIEMDLENNPIDSPKQVLKAIQNKKDILLLNLKLAPLMVKMQNYDEFIASVGSSKEDGLSDQKLTQTFSRLLTYLHNGTFYRRKRTYLRMRQQQQNLYVAERRFSNFSNDADSSNGATQQHNNNQSSGGAFKNLSGSGKNQRNNSTGHYHKRVRQGSNPQRSQRYEAIISLYEKLLEDEDKLLLQRKKKEARERKLQRQADGCQSDSRDFNSEDDDLDDDDDHSIDLDEDDDLDDLSSDGLDEAENQSYGAESKDVDLDDLQTYHNQHFGVELNASTADFNKEIKQINQQLLNEGHLPSDQVLPKRIPEETQPYQQKTLETIQSQLEDPVTPTNVHLAPTITQPSEPNSPALQDDTELDSTKNELLLDSKKPSSSNLSDQIDTQQISVAVPFEERSSRYTNRQHHQPSKEQETTSVIRSSAQVNEAGYGSDDVIDEKSAENATTDVNCQSEKQSVNVSQAASISGQSRKAPLSFKLDLAKVQNQGLMQQSQVSYKKKDIGSSSRQLTTNRGSIRNGSNDGTKQVIQVKMKPGETSLRYHPNHNQLMSVRKIQNQIQLAQISERIPIKKPMKSPNDTDMYISQTAVETSYLSAQIVKKKKPLPNNQKQVHIPKLALQNIQRQASEQSHNSQAAHWQQTNLVQIGQKQANQQMPKSLKVLTLSKRDDSLASNDKSFTIKHSQITKTLQGKELLDLYDKIDSQRKLIDDTKRVLGDQTMTDASIIDRIIDLQNLQQSMLVEKNHFVEQLIDRHQMQLEDLNGQIMRLQQQLDCTKPLQKNNYLEQLEQFKEAPIGANKSAGRSSYQVEGGLTLRLRENNNKISLAGGATAENQAILDLLKTQTQGSNKLAKTGRGPQLQQNLIDQSTIDPRLIIEQKQTSIGKHGRNTSKVTVKNSGRHSRHDSGGNAFELSSKREFLDLCQSPLGLQKMIDQQYQQDSTLERASNQDDIIVASTEKNPELKRIVSDFNPDQALASVQDQPSLQDDTAIIVQPLKLAEKAGTSGPQDKDDSFRRVGFFLEKIKERNSSLQERLNLSFKKSSRLDHSSISYRPTTSFGNKKALRGALVERDCISLTRDLDSKIGHSDSSRGGPSLPQQSKTPNILNMQCKQAIETAGQDENHHAGKWKGLKPQLVTSKPVSQQMQTSQQTQQLLKKQRVSPTNNYMEFLQTGQIENNSNQTRPTDMQRKSAYQNQQISALSMLEEAKHVTDGLKKQTLNHPSTTEHKDKDPLFNFNQCTEVLYQLSTTSRSRKNPSSSKNNFTVSLQPKVTANISQQYSSLLKQRSNNAIKQKNSTSLLEQGPTQTPTSQSLIQRASSHEMVPRLAPKQNNYVTATQQVVHHNHQSSHGPAATTNLGGYWTQMDHNNSLDISRISQNQDAPQKPQQTVKKNPSILNKSLQTYQRVSKGLNNSITAGANGNAYQNNTGTFRSSANSSRQSQNQPMAKQPPSQQRQGKAKSCSKQLVPQQPQKVLGTNKLSLQLKGLGQHQSTAISNRMPAGRKAVHTDRARYQSNHMDEVPKTVPATTSQPEI